MRPGGPNSGKHVRLSFFLALAFGSGWIMRCDVLYYIILCGDMLYLILAWAFCAGAINI